MSSLRQNLLYALRSIALLLLLVSVARPEGGPARQAVFATQRSVAVVANLVSFRCHCRLVPRIDPAGVLKQIVRSMR
jgi:hypothetical protein